MINILFFIDTLSGGGAEKVLCTLVNNMDQRKFRITVQTLEEVDPRDYLVSGIRYKAVNRCKTPLGKKLFSYWVRLCAELKWLYPLYIKDDYDIEVAYLECGPTKIIAGSTNKKALKLAWVHCDLEKKEGISRQIQRMKNYYHSYDKVICVSETVKRSYETAIGATTEAIILHNVNDEHQILEQSLAFPPERSSVPTFAAVGRLSYEKGFDRLLDACHRLKNSGFDFHCWLIGEGAERQALEKQVSEYGLHQQVELLGFQSNPYPYMNAADFLVIPSRFEGFSTVATESLILGKPVITTPCSGMQELLEDSQYGLITEDSVEGLYAGIKKMLENPGLMQSYAQAAALRGKEFSKETILAQTEDFLQTTLNQKQNA